MEFEGLLLSWTHGHACFAFEVLQALFRVYFKILLAMSETQVQSLGQEDPLEKGMATHSSILA